jgi:hypothetical protein
MFDLPTLKPRFGAANSSKKKWWCGRVHDQVNASRREIITSAAKVLVLAFLVVLVLSGRGKN